ncbi:MAG: F0F1 ATP synthase subunit epsilon [Eggerthellaceae bacterium]|nr:F0F1 ATP synthase subunit epsilon [Eggerthellaceae bacterium]
MEGLRCVVCIPTRELFAGEIKYASVPSVDGDYGVLPGHELIVAANRSGGVLTLNLDEGGKEQRKFLLYEGASQVYNNILTVLGRFGVDVENINVDEVRSKAERMKERIAALEEAESENEDSQASVTLRVSRKRLEWYEMQIKYAEDNH